MDLQLCTRHLCEAVLRWHTLCMYIHRSLLCVARSVCTVLMDIIKAISLKIHYLCSNKSTRAEISHGFQKWSQKVPYDIRKTYILESHYEST